MMRHVPAIGRRLTVALALSVALTAVACAENAPSNAGYDSPEEVFAAYKKATNDRAWRNLFSIFTAERQNVEILHIAIQAAVSNDETLRTIVKRNGVNWEEFDREWTEDENKRLMEDMVAVAARIGKSATNRADLYAATRDHIAKVSDPSSLTVHELRKLVRDGATASGEAEGTARFSGTQTDNVTNASRQVVSEGSFTETLRFRRVAGKWYLD